MATRVSPPQNKTYYINPATLTFNENSGYGANLIQVSASSSCYISVYDPANGIGYSDADRNYQRWKVTAYNNKFPSNDKFYIYARLEKNGASALVVYDTKLRGVKGGLITITTDENGNEVTKEESVEEGHPYFHIRIGEVSATDGTSIREITYDTGYLMSDEFANDKTGESEMWKLDKYSYVNPLIQALHWLKDFTVKGFITLVGGLIFKKGDTEKPITDIKRSTDDDVPVSDETIPTTAYIRSISDDRYLKKYEPDETNYRIKFYDGIEAGHFVKGMIGGAGTQFDGQGYGEMNGLTLREFLEVPELRFNRIDVVSGELWNSIAFGLVESVDTERRICHIKLEERERCGLHVYDICRGIFADFGDGTQWEGVDECGFLHLYGFWTSYFTPTKILENGEGVFSFQYELKAGTTQHPTASMKFAVYGNFVDASRQASAYSTRTYKRYLNKVDTWVINPDKHIYAQYGDLEGLTIGGMTMHGYGSFQSNSYFTGVQIQFTKQQKLELQGESAYTAVLSDYEGVVVIDDEGNIIGGETEMLNVVTGDENVTASGQNVVTTSYKLQTLVQAMKGTEALLYSAVSPSEGCYSVAVNSVGCAAMVLNGSVVVTSVTNTERCYVDIVVNCEGAASFNLTYRINAVRDGKNPIIADIDNEMDSVACDSSGKVLFGLPVSCTVSMWAGVKQLVIERMEVVAHEGVTVEYDAATGVVSVPDGGISDEAERTLPILITAYAQYGGVLYHKDLTFTVNKVVAGENALLYKLSPSASSVKVDAEGNMTADSIQCKVVASDGKSLSVLEELPEDLSMEYFLDNEEAQTYTYNTDVGLNDGNSTVTFRLYWNGKLIDVETIPVLLDGSSPVSIDLTNEMFSVACDEDGQVVLMPEMSSSAIMYWGSKALDTEIVSVSAPDGVGVSFAGNIVTVGSVSKEAEDAIRIAVEAKAEFGGTEYTRTAYLVVNKIRQGASAWVLDLLPSVSAVKVDRKGGYSPLAVSCRTRLITGKEASEPGGLQDNYSMWYSVDGGKEQSYSYGKEIAVSPEYDKNITGLESDVTFYLYYSKDNGLSEPWVLVDKETVPVLADAADSFKSTVFRRTNDTPDTPEGGSYDSPVPDGGLWSDGIPEGEEILWASVRTFTSDGEYPQDEAWSVPSQMTDTSSFDVEFSSVESPSAPSGHPNTNSQWSNSSSEDTIWMATSVKTNGVWSDWQVSRIKGEKGEDGAKGDKGDKGDTGAAAHSYSISPEAFTIGVNSLGSLEPSSMTFTCYDDSGTSNRETETAYWYVYVSNDGNSYSLWNSYTSYVSSYNVSFSTSYKYYKVVAKPYSNIECTATGTVVRDGSNEAAGSMPYNCGEWSSSASYYYNADRRDIVNYNGGVYMVKNFNAGGSISGYLPTNTSYWVQASKDIFRAMDTALIDGANIAGFMFKDNVLKSQDENLILDGGSGSITSVGSIFEMTLTSDDDAGSPHLSWASGSTEYARIGVSSVQGYTSGAVALSNNSSQSALLAPAFLRVDGARTAVLNVQTTTGCNLMFSGYVSGYLKTVYFGMDSSGYARIKGSFYKDRTKVNIGELWVDDDGYIKLRES